MSGKTDINRHLIVLLAFLASAGGNAKADFIFGTPTNLGTSINSPTTEMEPSISTDGLELFFEFRPSMYGYGDIYVSSRETTSDPWGKAENLGPTVNSAVWDMSPTISPDGLSLYFTSSRSGGWDLWVTTRATKDAPWGTPTRFNIGPTFSGATDWALSFSADGLELYFASNRPNGFGGDDIWVATRATLDDSWGEPVNLGPTVNSSHEECFPDISADGLTLFFSDHMYGPFRPGGYGGQDLWVTTRPTKNDAWGEPVNLGPVVNSSVWDFSPNIAADGSTLYFASERSGGIGIDDLWQVPILPVVDFNGDGIVDSADMCIMIDHWHTDETLCDIGPTPFGDGVVDFQDLVALCEYWLADYRLIAYWKLDETEGNIGADSAADNESTLHGEPLWQADAGRTGGALQLDGIDDYISTEFALNPVEGSFSLFAWVKGGGPGQVIISQKDRQVGRSIQPGSTWLGLDQSDGGLVTTLMELSYPPLKSHVAINDGQWHDVGLVYDCDGSHRRLYVDGVEVAKDIGAVAGINSSGGLHFGTGRYLDAGSFFCGLMDDVRIYNVALSPEEIEELSR
jgi:Tol biopolymer transport system component